MKTYKSSRRQVFIVVVLLLLSAATAPSLFAQVSIGSGGFNSTNLCSSSSVTAGCLVAGNADATLSSSGGFLQLTAAYYSQVGSAWTVTPQTVANGFKSTFAFQFSNPSTPPADGIAFVIQNAPTGLAAIGYTGGVGGPLGYGEDDLDDYPNSGIQNSLAIEFDSFQNGWDPDSDHIAVQSCGTAYNTSHHNQPCTVTGGSSVSSTIGITAAGALAASGVTITDGNPHTVTIQYNPPGTPCNTSNSDDTNNLCIYIDQQNVTPPVPALTVSVNLSTLLSLGNAGTAYVGFTAATGGDWETQDIQSWSFSQTIVGAPLTPGTTDTFNFNTTQGSLDIVSAIVPSVSTLTNSGATPAITAFSVPPSNPSSLWANSPLATASCIPLVSAGGNCAPKLVVCTTSTNATPSGVNCPYDSTGAEDVLLSDQFDPSTPITSFPAGQNPGVVSLNDTQGCPFATPFASLPCPSNGLKSFSGDPAPVHGSSNSYYYYVTGILAPSTMPAGFVNVGNAYWISQNPNTKAPAVTLTATPPGAPNPNTNGWYPSPIDYIAYVNLSSAAAGPNPNYPLNLQNSQGVVTPGNPLGAVIDFSDNVLSNGFVISTGIAPPPTPPSTTASTCGNVLGSSGNIDPASSSYSFEVPVSLGTLIDQDSYTFYYESEDCTRTAERVYNYLGSPQGWTTQYKSVTYTVDNDPPVVTITVPSAGAIYPANATIASSFNCSDEVSGVEGSGVATCNGPSQINTTPTGGILTPETFTVTSSDNVGNITNPPNGVTVNYFVSCLYAENTISPTTFARGQNFTITPSVTNCTKSLQSLTVSVVLTGPMGASCATEMLTLVNGVTVPVLAGLSVKATFGPFSVPKNACAGNYTFTTTSSTKGAADFTYSQSLTVD